MDNQTVETLFQFFATLRTSFRHLPCLFSLFLLLVLTVLFPTLHLLKRQKPCVKFTENQLPGKFGAPRILDSVTECIFVSADT